MKYILVVIALLSVAFNVQSQNLFPSSGKVGIGTSSPAALLHVNVGNIKLTNPAGYPYGINLDVNFAGTWARELGISYGGRGKLADFGGDASANAGSSIFFETGRTSSPSPVRMTINGAGNVGIGTTNPWRQNINVLDSPVYH